MMKRLIPFSCYLLVILLILCQMLQAFRFSHRLSVLQRKNVLNPAYWDRVKSTKHFSSLNEIVLAKKDTALLAPKKNPQFVFVGGKGGVGKTTTSSAIALACSDNGLRTLVVSTDPAHSLGDALDVDLSIGMVRQIASEENLWGLEIDIQEGMKQFQGLLNVDTSRLAEQINLPKEMLDIIDLDEIIKIFKNPPPGIDEIFALTKIFQFTDERSPIKFDRIIIDTAPTGHTLRLLQLPKFLSNTATKILKFRAQVDRAMNTFGSMFSGGGGGGKNNNDATDKLLKVFENIETLQKNVQQLQKIIKDSEQTQFVVVTIPTYVAYQESQRLIQSLQQSQIKVSTVICNQIVNEDANELYLKDRSDNQLMWIQHMKNHLASANPPIEITEVPFVSNEVTTIYGLKYFQNLVHPIEAKTPRNPIDSRKLTIFGGKGGVGKSTSAATWAVRLSEAGFKTLLVSSDPAHSLGDVFRESFKSIPTFIETTAEKGELWALEIDPSQAIADFKQTTIRDLELNNYNEKDEDSMMNMIFDPKDPPPGIDELAAVSKVISFLEEGYKTPYGDIIKFDRIVLDTAPTGHTLRMLELPAFMQSFLSTVRKATDKMSMLTGMLSGGADAKSSETMSEKMLKLQQRMKKFELMLHNPKETEFTVVTIPTQLASAESKRLLQSLQEKKVLVRRLIMNQVIRREEGQSYLNTVKSGQAMVLRDLEQLSNSNRLPLVKIPYFPTEMRTVYALRYVGKTIFPDQQL